MSEQTKDGDQFTFDYEPIRGMPELKWQGKKPFTGTSYYPAQLKETYGEPDDDGWMNKLYWGDNMQVMSHLLKSYRGKVNLIYIDPPFDSKADYKKKIELRGKSAESDETAFEEKQYGDIWTNDDYLQFMYERLVLCRELLSDTGSIYLHCDWHRSHYLRMIMDEVFGSGNFRNEINWQKLTAVKSQSTFFSNLKDDILIFTKSDSFVFIKHFIEGSKDDKNYSLCEEISGRKYGSFDFTQSGQGPSRNFGTKYGNLEPPAGKHWIWSQEKIDEGLKNGRIIFTKNGLPRVKRYLDEKEGNSIGDIWNDEEVSPLSANSQERLDYPTQKPEALLERIIKASSNPGDIVFDCFMGSGTTQAVALKLGRRFLGADINLGAVQTTTKRLLSIMKETTGSGTELFGSSGDSKTKPAGFEVYTVNDYDFFRNELEAKRLIIEALGMQSLPAGDLFDAEYDGRMVSILGINRIATAAEFGKLLSNIDIASWQRRQAEKPTEPVERITFVCMGHDPSLKAQFEDEVGKLGFKVDVEIIDLLRDKKDLTYKRESSAVLVIKNNKLIIEEFYPMNLLQKLSIDKTDIADWKELADTVMIDWNYDGVTFSPALTDIPEKNEFVKGEYQIPENAGTIRVKITDLISESFEGNAEVEK